MTGGGQVIQPIIIRPENQPKGQENKLSSISPDIMRLNAILKLMEGPATLARISKEQIILESLVTAAERLGYSFPATNTMIRVARELSPGLDGLGRGEAVKCLVAHAQGSFYPASAFEQDKKPGLIQRFIAFMSGARKPENQNG